MEVIQWVAPFGISALTTAGVLWGGAKVYAGKWLDSRFNSRLEAVKLEGQKQLEAVKSEATSQLEAVRIEAQRQLEGTRQEHTSYIERVKFERSNLLDRSTKLNQREFEIIPKIWNAATDAHYAVMRLISRWQEGTNLHHITSAQFEAFLAESWLADWQKDELRSKTPLERNTYYSDQQGWKRLRDAQEAVVKLNVASAYGTIFLQPETNQQIEAFADKLRGAYGRFRDGKVWDLDRDLKDDDNAVDRYRADGTQAYDGLARYLRERYWNQQGAD